MIKTFFIVPNLR